MTPEEIAIELQRLDTALPELARAADETLRALQRAQSRADDADGDQPYPTAALRVALQELQQAEHEHEQAYSALGRNHQERARLNAMLGQVAA